MNHKIITHKQHKTTNWQGGTTSELYIFPESANFQDRNFNFRISTAKIHLKESEFTSLPNFNRELMILDGSIEIIHENQYSKKLKKYDVDSFKGDWKTSAKGTCIDFNLISKENYNGKIEIISLALKQKTGLNNSSDFLILYVFKGEISVKNKNTTILLEKGDVFVLKEKLDLEISSYKSSKIIVSKIETK